MSASEDQSSGASAARNWIANQPYLLLSITAACWAGNAVVGKLAAGHIAPVTLSFLRWSLAFLIILPFAWKHLVQDWAAIRGKLGIMILLSVTGIGAFNTMHSLSFVGFTFGCGAACLIPLFILELHTRPFMTIDAANVLSLLYVAVFPSTIAYLCFNRGVQLIGPNRAAPFFHLVPAFGTVMSIVFLGERPQLFHFIGFALVLTGVFVASRRPVKPAAVM